MKKQFLLIALFFAFVIALAWQGCNQDEDNNPPNNLNKEDWQSMEPLFSMQEEGNDMFSNYLLTQDTVAAINSLAEWFASDPDVEWAQPGMQGVMVKYKSGLRGGILVDGLKGEDLPGTPGPEWYKNKLSEPLLKSVPSKKKMIVLDPTFLEFVKAAVLIFGNYYEKYQNVFQEMAEKKDEDCTLDAFTNLDEYGYIHIMSHGIPWPYYDSYEKVYLMTGETPTEAVCEKYGEMIKSDDVIGIYSSELKRNVFCISPEFIMKYNDFSQDTVLFFGSFCFSFLGNWPNLVNKFANGAYFGYDWAIRVGRDVDYVNSLFDHLSNKQQATPWTTEKWFTETPEIPKQFYDDDYERTIKLQYTGNTDLTLWAHDKVKVSIHSTEADGAPVSVPGEINTGYTFICEVENADPQFLEFTWNFGDGTGSQVVSQDNSINYGWTTSGTYTVSVIVKDIATEELLGQANVNAIIQDAPQNYIDILHTIKHAEVRFDASGHHYFSDGSAFWDTEFYVSSQELDNSGGKITWDGPNFSAAGTYFYDDKDITISGFVSSDGDSLIYLKATRWWHDEFSTTYDSLIYEVRNIPLTSIAPSYPLAYYSVTGVAAQSHLASIYYKQFKESTLSYIYYTHTDWEYAEIRVTFYGSR